MHSEWIGIHNRASPEYANTGIFNWRAKTADEKNTLFDYRLNFVIDLSAGIGL